ncbi:class I SAM-dependent methyltransferase [Halococcus saccharolyticus]|uniref:Methyltransferase type 11 n=1 Tax=Halococcus saccharolyticus DSM 5350 TaxID=1227455 RepID=M0MHX4_9EURY|nr:class I SAM-dependent methyltransferase [Halococcus saccharolyticus]EMA44943.1 Methyltransferase type 11 [Halococcus saccharolyticus DSM 5350]
MDSTEVRRRWAERSGAYSPEYYAHHGPNATSEAIRERLAPVGRDATILELGCSSGRHLAHLHHNGYGNLNGIEINPEALDVMAETYPELAAQGTFHVDAIQDAVTEFDDGRFDVVFSVETLQHVHPDDDWVFDELCRITGDRLITSENEGEAADRRGTATDAMNEVDGVPLYYRNWKDVFTDRGFTEIGSEPVKRGTLRVFRSTRD